MPQTGANIQREPEEIPRSEMGKVGGRDPGHLDCFNPGTGAWVTSVPIASDREIGGKIASVKGHQESWGSLSLKERARYITKTRKRLVSSMDRMIDTICQETGKTRFEGLIEILVTGEIMRFAARKGPAVLSSEKRPQSLLKTKRGSVHYLPYGVVGIISPWNYPLILAMGPVVQALMAGNGVILKPSEYSPLTALMIKDLFDKSGFPPGLVEVVVGAGAVGEKLVASPDTDLICFTGSVDVGRKIAVACAEQLKPLILELGGKDSMIVLEDADLERAARAAVWGGFHNAGQTCISVERIFVMESVAEQFVDRVTELAREVRYGSGDTSVDMGAISNSRQMERVVAQVRDATEKGAEVVVGGSQSSESKGFIMEPTVLVDVNASMEVMQKETFGPVIAVTSVKSEAEALQMANSLGYGLNASIFTGDLRTARKMARDFQAGNVCINDVLTNYLCVDLPFGGVKSSGMGRLQGIEGIRSFAMVQAVCEDRFGLSKEPWWFPVSPAMKQAFRSFVKFWYG